MFDHAVSGENPRHMDFILNKAKPLFESWGYKVIILRSEKTYLELFYHRIEKPVKHIHHKGLRHGFPLTNLCMIKRDLKLKPIAEFKDSLGLLADGYVEYVGICADEPKRLASLRKNSNAHSLLEEYGYEKKDTKQLCLSYDLLSPVYELTKRGGCWMCPFSKRSECAEIKRRYPDVWKKFVSLENEPDIAFCKWNVYGDSLASLDASLEKEEK